jgi:DNA polymerase I-like protein with 3'-5' exonuclease and polymerase domains
VNILNIVKIVVLRKYCLINDLYNEVELPLSDILQEMQQAGVRIDVDMLKQAEELHRTVQHMQITSAQQFLVQEK